MTSLRLRIPILATLFQPFFNRLDPPGDLVKLPELDVLVQDVLGGQPLQSAVPGVQKTHQRLNGLGNALSEQGEALGNQFIPLPVKLGYLIPRTSAMA
jgi:hypothetical protein